MGAMGAMGAGRGCRRTPNRRGAASSRRKQTWRDPRFWKDTITRATQQQTNMSMSFRSPLAQPERQPGCRLRDVLQTGQAASLVPVEARIGADVTRVNGLIDKVVWDNDESETVKTWWKKSGHMHVTFHCQRLFYRGVYTPLKVEIRRSTPIMITSTQTEITWYGTEMMPPNGIPKKWNSAWQRLETWTPLKNLTPGVWTASEAISALLSSEVPGFTVLSVHGSTYTANTDGSLQETVHTLLNFADDLPRAHK